MWLENRHFIHRPWNLWQTNSVHTIPQKWYLSYFTSHCLGATLPFQSYSHFCSQRRKWITHNDESEHHWAYNDKHECLKPVLTAILKPISYGHFKWFFSFSKFFLFQTKKKKNIWKLQKKYFDQLSVVQAPKKWPKYTTTIALPYGGKMQEGLTWNLTSNDDIAGNGRP